MKRNLNKLYKICSMMASFSPGHLRLEDEGAFSWTHAYDSLGADLASNAMALYAELLDGHKDSIVVDLACRAVIEDLVILNQFEESEGEQDIASIGTALVNQGRVLRSLQDATRRIETDKELPNTDFDQILRNIKKIVAKNLKVPYKQIEEDIEQETFFLRFCSKTKDIHTYAELVKRYGETGHFEMHQFFSLRLHPNYVDDAEAEEIIQKTRDEYIEKTLQSLDYLVLYYNKFGPDAYPSYTAAKKKGLFRVGIGAPFYKGIDTLLRNPDFTPLDRWYLNKVESIFRSFSNLLSVSLYETALSLIKPFLEINAFYDRMKKADEESMTESFAVASISAFHERLDLEEQNQRLRPRVRALYEKKKPNIDKETFSKNLRGSLRYFLYDEEISYSKIMHRYFADDNFNFMDKKLAVEFYLSVSALAHAGYGYGYLDSIATEQVIETTILLCALDFMELFARYFTPRIDDYSKEAEAEANISAGLKCYVAGIAEIANWLSERQNQDVDQQGDEGDEDQLE